MLHTAVAGFSFLLCATARTPKHCISDFVSIQWFSDFKHLVFIQLFMQVAVFFSYYIVRSRGSLLFGEKEKWLLGEATTFSKT